MSCKKCTFVKEIESINYKSVTSVRYECKRFPPVVVPRTDPRIDFIFISPEVKYDDWCGEFKPKEIR